jgi:hypothetical protein
VVVVVAVAHQLGKTRLCGPAPSQPPSRERTDAMGPCRLITTALSTLHLDQIQNREWESAGESESERVGAFLLFSQPRVFSACTAIVRSCPSGWCDCASSAPSAVILDLVRSGVPAGAGGHKPFSSRLRTQAHLNHTTSGQSVGSGLLKRVVGRQEWAIGVGYLYGVLLRTEYERRNPALYGSPASSDQPSIVQLRGNSQQRQCITNHFVQLHDRAVFVGPQMPARRLFFLSRAATLAAILLQLFCIPLSKHTRTRYVALCHQHKNQSSTNPPPRSCSCTTNLLQTCHVQSY